MRVSNDITAVVDELRGAVVVGLGVNETARLEIGNLHAKGEGLVRLDGFAILGELEFRSWHVAGGGDYAHDGGVAGTGLDLQTISYGDVLGQAEVGKVVEAGLRSDLVISNICSLTILLGASRDLTGVKFKLGLKVSGLTGEESITVRKDWDGLNGGGNDSEKRNDRGGGKKHLE